MNNGFEVQKLVVYELLWNWLPFASASYFIYQLKNNPSVCILFSKLNLKFLARKLLGSNLPKCWGERNLTPTSHFNSCGVRICRWRVIKWSPWRTWNWYIIEKHISNEAWNNYQSRKEVETSLFMNSMERSSVNIPRLIEEHLVSYKDVENMNPINQAHGYW